MIQNNISKKKVIFYLFSLIALFILTGCAVDNGQIEKSEALPVMGQKEGMDKMIVHYIDVGQADATLIEFSDDETPFKMLIDTGDWNATDVVDYLHAEKINTIDIIAITHPHADHIGQLDKIIQTFDVGEVWMNGEVANSDIFNKALAAIEESDVDYYEPELGEVFDIGPVEVAIIHPADLSGGLNDNSLSMRLKYGKISFLFTGDSETKAEREMLARGEQVAATIYHAGHHGSKTSTTEDFFKAVNPEVVIYSAGAHNKYGHPDQEVVDRIKASGVNLYGTDVDGTIQLKTDGVTYTVQSKKERTTSTVDCIDINKATATEIEKIVHIGSERAVNLIQNRPYESIEDLHKINGIGPARIQDITAQGLACVGG